MPSHDCQELFSQPSHERLTSARRACKLYRTSFIIIGDNLTSPRRAHGAHEAGKGSSHRGARGTARHLQAARAGASDGSRGPLSGAAARGEGLSQRGQDVPAGRPRSLLARARGAAALIRRAASRAIALDISKEGGDETVLAARSGKGLTCRILGPNSRLAPLELAAIYGLTVGTLANWRAARPRRGPRFVRIGAAIRYRWKDVQKWEARRVSR